LILLASSGLYLAMLLILMYLMSRFNEN